MVEVMEQNSSIDKKHSERIDPPFEARYTTLVNGVGNAVMLGAVPVVGLNLWDDLRKKVVSEATRHKRQKVGIAIAAASVVIGVVIGEIEGRRLQAYRNKMSDRMADQGDRIEALEAELKTWRARAEKKEPAPSTEIGA
jgi:hypothetical protein